MLLARNRKPVAGWLFIFIWLGMLSIFTSLFLRDGAPNGLGPSFSVILCLFWIAGLGGCAYLLRIPTTSVRLMADGQLTVTERWLWTCQTEFCHPRSVAIEEHQDSDGSPYFFCFLETDSGRRVSIKESHRREDAEAARARVLRAVQID